MLKLFLCLCNLILILNNNKVKVDFFSILLRNYFIYLAIRSVSLSKHIGRPSKASIVNDRNHEFIFDEEHLLKLLQHLKQQSEHNSLPMSLDDESDLFDTLISRLF